MKTVADNFCQTPLTGNADRAAAKAQAIRIRGIRLANAVDVADRIAGVPADDGSWFIYAMAARKKAAPPTLVTVEMANGLALQMMKT